MLEVDVARNVKTVKPPVIGLDIGTSSVKLVELQSVDDGLKLKIFDYVPLDPGVIVDGKIINAENVAVPINLMVVRHNLHGRKAVISVGGLSVIHKLINLPEMSQADLNALMDAEAEIYIPFDIADVYVDSVIIGSDTSGHMKVLLTAAKRELVDKYLNVVIAAGLDPIYIDSDMYAMFNVFATTSEYSTDDKVILLDIGDSMMRVVAVKNGVIEFMREIPLGGALLTEEIARERGISWLKAEQIKLETSSFPDALDLQKVYNRVVGSLVEEINRAVDFYTAVTVDGGPSKVFAFGGGAKTPTLREKLAEKLGIPVELGQPLQSIRIDTSWAKSLEERQADLAVVIGLAMRQE
ncbi:type IV pilus assembly protein PilM [Candidatus Kuenenbacteria bacterium]|nr:type IV pilus assembly protein PilM [Candidatus Kuenenbacteria bacterium]